MLIFALNNQHTSIMAKTFNLELQTRPTKQGYYPVWVRITENRKHRRIKTSVVLSHLTDWNPKAKDDRKVRQSEPNFKQLNETLKKELDNIRLEANKEDNKTLSIEALTDSIKTGEKSESFLKFIGDKVEEIRKGASVSTYRNYKTAMGKVSDYVAFKNHTDLLFNEVNMTFVKSFESYLNGLKNSRDKQDGDNERTLKQSTKSKTLRVLRTMINLAVSEGKMASSPFGRESGKFKIKPSGDSQKEKLEAEELERIISLDLPAGSALWHTRNAFLFSFYCAGIRVGDLLQLRWGNLSGTELSYQMDKNGKRWQNELVEGALEILEQYRTAPHKPSDYIFPFLDSQKAWAIQSFSDSDTMGEPLRKDLFDNISSKTTLLNKNLKKIAEIAGIDKKVTFHTSRHTFAYLAMKGNLPAKVTQNLLGHSSVKTTEVYMGNFSHRETSIALKQVYSQLDKGSQDSQKEALLEELKNLDKETLVELLTKTLTQNK